MVREHSVPNGERIHEVELVRAAVIGDAQAFAMLYRRHVVGLRRLIHRKGCREEIDDLTQEIFMRAWQRLSSFRHEAGFRTWLTRIALNAIADHYRARATRHRLQGSVTDLADWTLPQAPASTTAGIRLVFAQLPRSHRRVLTLCDLLGYRQREAAYRMGVPVGTIKSHLHRARRTFQRVWASQSY